MRVYCYQFISGTKADRRMDNRITIDWLHWYGDATEQQKDAKILHCSVKTQWMRYFYDLDLHNYQQCYNVFLLVSVIVMKYFHTNFITFFYFSHTIVNSWSLLIESINEPFIVLLDKANTYYIYYNINKAYFWVSFLGKTLLNT